MTGSITRTTTIGSNWNSEQVALIKQQIAVGASDEELELFGQVCQRTGLDPFSRQIYAIKRGSKVTIQVSIDGLRTIAARSGLYGGSTTEWCGEDGKWRDIWIGAGNPYAAKTTVWRIGSPNPFTGVAKFENYTQSQGLWSKMPDTMIAKCSEGLALRKAFPAELSSLYTLEEIPFDGIESVADSNRGILAVKTRVVEIFQLLGWNKEKQKAWASNFSAKNSKDWTLTEWESALDSVTKILENLTSSPT